MSIAGSQNAKTNDAFAIELIRRDVNYGLHIFRLNGQRKTKWYRLTEKIDSNEVNT